eukprot:TRINITY_DN1565_c0_g1_i3.p1 TRINITY_DN1565_c0_g1~~TRINITY_DN1565_c0_g1_i3.p1  ORF type:complete len:268 (+),score=31.88 TRINITY_DN1565_c0_g1_i3:50-805(+)
MNPAWAQGSHQPNQQPHLHTNGHQNSMALSAASPTAYHSDVGRRVVHVEAAPAMPSSRPPVQRGVHCAKPSPQTQPTHAYRTAPQLPPQSLQPALSSGGQYHAPLPQQPQSTPQYFAPLPPQPPQQYHAQLPPTPNAAPHQSYYPQPQVHPCPPQVSPRPVSGQQSLQPPQVSPRPVSGQYQPLQPPQVSPRPVSGQYQPLQPPQVSPRPVSGHYQSSLQPPQVSPRPVSGQYQPVQSPKASPRQYQAFSP